MRLTPQEEAMHLEVKALLEFKPEHIEQQIIYTNALEIFFEQHREYILRTLDLHLTNKSKE